MSVETRLVYRCPECEQLFVEENQKSRWHIADAVDECITIRFPNGRTMMTNFCHKGLFRFNLAERGWSCEEAPESEMRNIVHHCIKNLKISSDEGKNQSLKSRSFQK